MNRVKSVAWWKYRTPVHPVWHFPYILLCIVQRFNEFCMACLAKYFLNTPDQNSLSGPCPDNSTWVKHALIIYAYVALLGCKPFSLVVYICRQLCEFSSWASQSQIDIMVMCHHANDSVNQQVIDMYGCMLVMMRTLWTNQSESSIMICHYDEDTMNQ